MDCASVWGIDRLLRRSSRGQRLRGLVGVPGGLRGVADDEPHHHRRGVRYRLVGPALDGSTNAFLTC